MEEIINAINSWNPWWIEEEKNAEREKILSSVSRRILPLIGQTLQTRHVKDILGIRRSGKTTLLHQIINKILEERKNPEEILFLAFDDPNLILVPFDKIIDTASFLHPNIKFLFIDEIHAKERWELWIKKIYDMNKFAQIFISGSNAALLSDDVGKALTGRHLSFFLTPFTFHEYLVTAQWKDYSQEFLRSKFPQLLHEFDKYLIWGGFPEIIDLNDSLKRQILVDLYNDVLARDISTRISIDYGKMNRLATYLFTNFTREYSVNKLAKAVNLHPDTTAHYLQLLENALMIKIISRFSYKLKIQFRQNKKVYAVDNGLRNAVSFHTTKDRGKYAENLVCMELLRRKKEIYYWKDDKHEVDFIVRDGGIIEELIQVSWNMKKDSTRKREFNGLVAACHLYKLSKGTILTLDEEETVVHNGITITIKPIPLWLLEGKKMDMQ
ncbi:MAG: ATP-binding protein [Promethearchaeota archaeon]